MKTRWFCFLVLAAPQVVLGCATVPRGEGPKEAASAGARAWHALLEGKNSEASTLLARELTDSARDADADARVDTRALFAAMTLAYERGRAESAMSNALAMLERASSGQDALATALAAAALVRVPRLLAEIPDRRASEDRLVALSASAGRLPWQARYALALAVIDIARRRADEGLLAKTIERGAPA